MTNNARELNETTVVLTVRIRKPGVSQKVDSNDVRVRARGVEDAAAQDPEASSVRVSKKLLESREYAEIAALDVAIRSWLKSQSLPTKLAGGCYLVPLALVEAIDAKIEKFNAERELLVEKFVAAYPGLVEAAEKRLGDLFDHRDYVSPAAIGDAFAIETKLAALEMPGTGLATFSAALYERETRKAIAAREAMVGEIRDGVRFAMGELVNTLIDRLTPGEDGQTKRVLGTHVEGLQAFLTDFTARDVAGDEDLRELVDQARALVKGVDVKTLRRSTSVRSELAVGLESLKTKLDTLISGNSSTLRASYLELGEVESRAPEGPVTASRAEVDYQDETTAVHAEPLPVGATRASVDEDEIAPSEAPRTAQRAELDI